MHPKSYDALSLRDDILATLQRVAPHAQACGAGSALDHLRLAALQGSDAAFLRRQREQSGSSEGMVNAAIVAFRAGSQRSPRALMIGRGRSRQPNDSHCVASSRSRSRALPASAAARSNSAAASPLRPSLASRSPRTLGSH